MAVIKHIKRFLNKRVTAKQFNLIQNLAKPFMVIFHFIIGHGGVYFNYLINSNKPFKYNLATVAILRNEAPYIKEWIEYHKLIGVEHFFIYDNYSTDNILDVLRPYIDAGEVTYTIFPNKEIHSNRIQIKAYNNAIKRYRNVTKWLAVIDVDEFIVPMGTNSLINILKTNSQKEVTAIEIFWVLYGYSGNYNRPKGLLIENYTKSSDTTKLKELPTYWEWMRKEFFKTIVNPRMVIKKGIHGAQYIHIHGHKIVQMDKSTLRLNHYWTKSYEELCEKLNRNANWNPLRKDKYKTIPEYESDFLSHNDDYVMEKYVPLLKEKMGIC